MEFSARLHDVRRRPAAYGLDGSYTNFVAFINGADAATGSELLRAFRPWLAHKLGRGANLVWWVLVQELFATEAGAQRMTMLYEAQLCERMFDLLAEYFADRDVKANSQASK